MGYRQFFIVEHDSGYEVETTLHAAIQRQADFGGRIFHAEGKMVVPGSKIENDGWIEWRGGEQPVPSSTPVEIKFRCGETSRNNSAGVWRWDWEPDDLGHYEIVAYRVIENDGREG